MKVLIFDFDKGREYFTAHILYNRNYILYTILLEKEIIIFLKMGSSASYCCRDKIRAKFDNCENIKTLIVIIKSEINRIGDQTRKLGIKSHDDISEQNKEKELISMFAKTPLETDQRKSKDRERFYYYLKLEMTLLRVKNLIEEVHMPNNFYKSFTKTTSFSSSKTITKILLPNISEIPDTILNFEDEESKDPPYIIGDIRDLPEGECVPIRRPLKSKSTKTIYKVQKKIELDVCIEYLIHVLRTEDSVKIEELRELEKNLEIKLFNIDPSLI
jgi:hypothetical protein